MANKSKAVMLRESEDRLRLKGYKIIPPDRHYCTVCKKNKLKGEFYYSNHKFNTDNVLHICKSCLKKVHEEYVTETRGNRKRAMFLMSQELRLPWVESAWQMTESSKTAEYRTYIGKLNSMIQYKDLIVADSDDYIGDYIDLTDDKELTTKNMTKKKKRELLDRWGSGYKDEEYIYMAKEYANWISRYKSNEYSEEKIFELIVFRQLEIKKGREAGKKVDGAIKSLQELMKFVNAKPVDLSAGKNSEKETELGLRIKEMEKYHPADFFRDKQLFKDYDGIQDLIQRFIVRPLLNNLTGSRDFDPEYDVNKEIIENAKINSADIEDIEVSDKDG